MKGAAFAGGKGIRQTEYERLVGINIDVVKTVLKVPERVKRLLKRQQSDISRVDLSGKK